MDKKGINKTDFSFLVKQANKIYKETKQLHSDSYIQGKKEAFEEILQWFINSQNGNIKFVQSTPFCKMLQNKLSPVKGDKEEQENNNNNKKEENNETMIIDDDGENISQN